MKNTPKTVAVILAAGYSSRMGTFKPLLEIGGSSALRHLLDSIARSGIKTVILVTGYRAEEIRTEVLRISTDLSADMQLYFAHNEKFAEGMFSSVQTGIRQAESLDAHNILLFPVDSPLIAPGSIRKVMRAGAGSSLDVGELVGAGSSASADKDTPATAAVGSSAGTDRNAPADLDKQECFAVACYRGKKGHPLLIPHTFFNEIFAYEGPGGLSAVTARYIDRFIYVETADEGVVLDMDTPEHYRELLQYYQTVETAEETDERCPLQYCQTDETAGNRPHLSPQLSCGSRRLILVRHGSIMPHREKIFLGQTDVPLSDIGRAEARAAAEEIIRLYREVGTSEFDVSDFGASGVDKEEFGARALPRIYSSDLARASETAQIIADALHAATVSGLPAISVSSARSDISTESGLPAERKRPEVILTAGFREMSLGDWDGRYISEVIAAFPEEYEKRGRDLLRYKRPGGENFYDLRYRAMKELKRILQSETDRQSDPTPVAQTGVCQDPTLVAHAGVIRAILSEVREIPAAEAWKMDVPRGSVIPILLR